MGADADVHLLPVGALGLGVRLRRRRGRRPARAGGAAARDWPPPSPTPESTPACTIPATSWSGRWSAPRSARQPPPSPGWCAAGPDRRRATDDGRRPRHGGGRRVRLRRPLGAFAGHRDHPGDGLRGRRARRRGRRPRLDRASRDRRNGEDLDLGHPHRRPVHRRHAHRRPRPAPRGRPPRAAPRRRPAVDDRRGHRGGVGPLPRSRPVAGRRAGDSARPHGCGAGSGGGHRSDPAITGAPGPERREWAQ